MKTDCYVVSDDKHELRIMITHGLVCPNPTEYYKMTRSYEDMRKEYELLNCDKITHEDLIRILRERNDIYGVLINERIF